MRNQAFVQPAIISIHAPLAGCDIIISTHRAAGGRISIHAPLAGCDFLPSYGIVAAKYFNPRTPCGVRQIHTGPCGLQAKNFNPRTPCGVRRTHLPYIPHIVRISIHAPLAGCDSPLGIVCPCGIVFQSTHPLRGATCERISACAMD